MTDQSQQLERLSSPSAVAGGDAQAEVLFEVVNGVGVITLNRPKKLNALTHSMVLQISGRLSEWRTRPDIAAVLLRGAGEKGFCAGGDIKALYESYLSGTADYQRFFIDEYRLDFTIHRYPKPVIALMDGIVMGGGMGLAQGAHLRLVTERSKIAMPETGIGLVPDVGASWFLSKMPVELSLYLGMTGATMGGADAVFCGLADAAVSTSVSANILATLEEVRWTGDPLRDIKRALAVDEEARPPTKPSLFGQLPTIVRNFKADLPLARIIERLDAVAMGACDSWESEVLKTLSTRSPLMTEVTRELLLRGRRLDLADCFRMELDVVCNAFTDGDFIEGVRALIIEKDSSPTWRVTDASLVDSTMVGKFFSSPWKESGGHPLGALASRSILARSDAGVRAETGRVEA